MSQRPEKVSQADLSDKILTTLKIFSEFTRKNKLVAQLPVEWNPDTQTFHCTSNNNDLIYWFISHVLTVSTCIMSCVILLHELFAVSAKVSLVGLVVQVLVVAGLNSTLLVEIAIYYYRFEFAEGVNKLLLLCSNLKSGCQSLEDNVKFDNKMGFIMQVVVISTCFLPPILVAIGLTVNMDPIHVLMKLYFFDILTSYNVIYLHVFKYVHYTLLLFQFGPNFAVGLFNIIIVDHQVFTSLDRITRQFKNGIPCTYNFIKTKRNYNRLRILLQCVVPLKEFLDCTVIFSVAILTVVYSYLTIKAYHLIPLGFYVHYPSTTISLFVLVNFMLTVKTQLNIQSESLLRRLRSDKLVTNNILLKSSLKSLPEMNWYLRVGGFRLVCVQRHSIINYFSAELSYIVSSILASSS